MTTIIEEKIIYFFTALHLSEIVRIVGFVGNKRCNRVVYLVYLLLPTNTDESNIYYFQQIYTEKSRIKVIQTK